MKIIRIGKVGNFYKIHKTFYEKSEACIEINNPNTPWFDIISGVKQDDKLSPLLFSTLINDLGGQRRSLDLVIEIDGINYSILQYADDIEI